MKKKKRRWRDANEVIKATILPIQLNSLDVEMRKNRGLKNIDEPGRTNSRLE